MLLAQLLLEFCMKHVRLLKQQHGLQTINLAQGNSQHKRAYGSASSWLRLVNDDHSNHQCVRTRQGLKNHLKVLHL